jgi:hypothetical protein
LINSPKIGWFLTMPKCQENFSFYSHTLLYPTLPTCRFSFYFTHLSTFVSPPLTSQLIPHFPCISKDFLFFQLTSTFIFSSIPLISPLLCPCGTFILHSGSGELVGLYFSGKFMVLGVLRQLGAIGPVGHSCCGSWSWWDTNASGYPWSSIVQHFCCWGSLILVGNLCCLGVRGSVSLLGHFSCWGS